MDHLVEYIVVIFIVAILAITTIAITSKSDTPPIIEGGNVVRLDSDYYFYRIVDKEAGVVCYEGKATSCMPLSETKLDK